MWEDPIVAEVRRVRLAIEQECEGDFEKIYLQALAVQEKLADRVAATPASKVKEEEKVNLNSTSDCLVLAEVPDIESD